MTDTITVKITICETARSFELLAFAGADGTVASYLRRMSERATFVEIAIEPDVACDWSIFPETLAVLYPHDTCPQVDDVTWFGPTTQG
jgi:hypothetical protein